MQLFEKEKMWMERVYSISQLSNIVNYSNLLIKLGPTIGFDFRPEDIDERCFDQNGCVSIYGMKKYGIDTDILNYIDKIVPYLGRMLKNGKNKFVTSEVADELKLKPVDVKKSLKLLQPLSVRFYDSGISDVGHGVEVINGLHSFAIENMKTIRNCINFESIEKVIDDIQEKNKIAPPKKQEAIQKGNPVINNTAFVLMWIDDKKPELVDILNAVKDTFKKYDVEAFRVDEVEHSDKITDMILDQISKSEFIFADLTGERPNVYYEIGYAHAIGKRPILYRKKGTKLHFDLSIHNVPEYENISELKLMLSKRLEAILGRTSN